jgi:hypothetical protein
LIETHAGQHHAARRFDPCGEAQAIAIRLHLGARNRKQRDFGVAPVEQAGEVVHFHQAELRRREHHQIDFADILGVARLKGAQIGFADRVRR